MGLKIRITASHGKPGRGPVPPLIYRAEAYEEADEFRETLWRCEHDHRTVEHALDCGLDWLEQGTQLESA